MDLRYKSVSSYSFFGGKKFPKTTENIPLDSTTSHFLFLKKKKKKINFTNPIAIHATNRNLINVHKLFTQITVKSRFRDQQEIHAEKEHLELIFSKTIRKRS